MDHGSKCKAYKIFRRKQVGISLWLGLGKDFLDVTRKAQSNQRK